MLFQVQYVGGGIEELQNALSHFLNEIKSESHNAFSANLFPASFRTKLYKWGNAANEYKSYVSEFQAIFNALTSPDITQEQRQQFVTAFETSNEILNICDDTNLLPIHFLDVDNALRDVCIHFLRLYTTLYADFIKNTHPSDFKIKNGRICPVCGLDTINPYDHYFPKGTETPIYPFSAINPKNLIPVCPKCNGGKSAKLILFQDSTKNSNRVLVLFPYANFEGWENLDFELTNLEEPTIGTYGKWKIAIRPKTGLTPDVVSKLERWRDFFEIEQRYAEELKSFIATWTSSLAVDNIKIDDIISAAKPSRGKVREELGIILKWLFFCLLKQNEPLRKLFFPEKLTAINPSDLLNG